MICILCNGYVIKYHQFISVVVIELLVKCLNTGPEDLYSVQWVRNKVSSIYLCSSYRTFR